MAGRWWEKFRGKFRERLRHVFQRRLPVSDDGWRFASAPAAPFECTKTAAALNVTRGPAVRASDLRWPIRWAVRRWLIAAADWIDPEREPAKLVFSVEPFDPIKSPLNDIGKQGRDCG